jgi:ribose/xylose/arabinose/galactoside ABC-type transport system permease subunit
LPCGPVVFLRKPTAGHYVYSIGANETAARFSGVSVTRCKCAFVISAVLGALTGFLLVG